MEKITDVFTEWNRIGSPFNKEISLEDVFVSVGGSVFTWEEATSMEDPIVLNTIYRWDAIEQLEKVTSTFKPGEGYWMYSYQDCTLLADINDYSKYLLPAVALIGIVGVGVVLAKR